jgi:hypothetical protein
LIPKTIEPLTTTLLALSLLYAGCSDKRPPVRIVEGTVRCGDVDVEQGQIRYVPIADTPGGTNVADIRDGRYRMDARGGIPLGRYRVEIAAKKPTGRKIAGYTGFEQGMVDETVRLGPPSYDGPHSPLTVEVARQGDGRFDFNLPIAGQARDATTPTEGKPATGKIQP